MAEDLILEVIDGPVEANMAGHKKIFARAGGSIGRADSNSWVLPDMDRIISSVHADIVFASGHYFIVDKSTNGTFINGQDHPLGSGNKSQISDGDVISIGHYQFKSVLQVCKDELPDGLGSVDFLDASDKTTIGSLAMSPESSESSVNAQFDSWLEPGQFGSGAKDVWGAIEATPQSASVDPLADPLSGVGGSDILDPLAALVGQGGTGAMSSLQTPSADPWQGGQNTSDEWWLNDNDHAPVEQQSMAVPQPQPAQIQPAPIQQPIAQAQPQVPTPAPGPAMVHQPESRSLDSMSLDELLAPGSEMPQTAAPASAPTLEPVQPVVPPPADVAPQPVPDQVQNPHVSPSSLARELGVEGVDPAQLNNLDGEAGAFIRETSSRLIDLLRARSNIKNELRVERTMIQSQDNNPLKFSATAQDALGMMFGGNGSSFMSPSEAVRDSFDNLSDHQVAVLAAMRSAFEFMLSQFNPDNLEQRFSKNAGKGFMSNKKAKNWEAYQSWFSEMSKDPEQSYNRLFGEVFAEAYEKKIAELNAVRNIQ